MVLIIRAAVGRVDLCRGRERRSLISSADLLRLTFSSPSLLIFWLILLLTLAIHGRLGPKSREIILILSANWHRSFFRIKASFLLILFILLLHWLLMFFFWHIWPGWHIWHALHSKRWCESSLGKGCLEQFRIQLTANRLQHFSDF